MAVYDSGTYGARRQIDHTHTQKRTQIMNPIKSLIHGTMSRFGYQIDRIPPPEDHAEYQKVRPGATYNPWNTDRKFKEIYTAIRGFTLVDRYRCYELWKLVEQSAKLAEGGVIEIGVWRGGTGALIARQAHDCGITEKVYLCDTFTGVVKAGEKDSYYSGGEHSDTSQELVENLVFKTMGLDNVRILKGIFPDDTGHEVEEQTFRFCHIDVDSYQSAHDIIEWIWERMASGGIIVYDDYGFFGCDGITRHVDEQMSAPDRIILHNLNGHAIIIKR